MSNEEGARSANVERAFLFVAFALALSISVACFVGSDTSDGGTDASSDATTDADASTSLFPDSGILNPFGDASLAIRTRALFSSTCSGGPESGCHVEHAANLTLHLDPDGGDVINVPSSEIPGVLRVVPFHPELSYVYWKVTDDPRIDGGAMPLDLTPDPRIPDLIGTWIEAGAP